MVKDLLKGMFEKRRSTCGGCLFSTKDKVSRFFFNQTAIKKSDPCICLCILLGILLKACTTKELRLDCKHDF